MSSLCTLLGYTRQAYYSQQQYHQSHKYQGDLLIQQVYKHRQFQPRLGTRKLVVMLQEFIDCHHFKIGRDALFDLLRDHGLLVRKRKRKAKTTFSNHIYRKYPNLIRGFEPTGPNQLWVSDITYIIVGTDFAYLSLVTDAYSRKIVGYHLNETLGADGSVRALQMAFLTAEDLKNLIHHSDRGIQYCCYEYVGLLEKNGVKISMTENGDPLENAIAERVNGILKDELLQQRYSDFASAQRSIDRAVEIYNTLRPHSSCEMLTPNQAYQKTGRLKRTWKNYYKKKEVTMG